MIDFRNRLIYKGYVIGNYYFSPNPNKTDYVIELWGTNIRTTNYTTARKAICKKSKDIKKLIVDNKEYRFATYNNTKIVKYDVLGYAKEKGLSVEEAGRLLRYEAFEECCGPNSRIAVAHHMNDRAETVLFNICRGTGLKGLGGIKPVRDKVIRPLLCCQRWEIEKYLSENGQGYCTDSTNDTDDYSRNLLRNKVTEDEISQIVSRWTGIPVSKIMKGDKDKVLSLYDVLSKRVIGQDDAIPATPRLLLLIALMTPAHAVP